MDILLQEGERVDEINDRVRLIQRERGLTFGTDAYLLSCFCRPAKAARAADLGCGTGVISLLLAARERYASIFAVEAQESFASLAARNVELNGFSHTVSVLNCDVRALSPADFGGELDVIVTNPPYMRADSGYACTHEEKQIARHEILGDLADFTAAAARCLRYGGSLYVVYRPDRLETLFAALRTAKFAPKRMLFVQDAPEKAPSMVLCEARLGGGEGVAVLPTLILRESAQNGAPLTPRAQRIYDTGWIE
ncbi:MAG: methyltransferase [Clostridia bacterium]|nr:methyltransferase [Clostridia bacterium]